MCLRCVIFCVYIFAATRPRRSSPSDELSLRPCARDSVAVVSLAPRTPILRIQFLRRNVRKPTTSPTSSAVSTTVRQPPHVLPLYTWRARARDPIAPDYFAVLTSLPPCCCPPRFTRFQIYLLARPITATTQGLLSELDPISLLLLLLGAIPDSREPRPERESPRGYLTRPIASCPWSPARPRNYRIHIFLIGARPRAHCGHLRSSDLSQCSSYAAAAICEKYLSLVRPSSS